DALGAHPATDRGLLARPLLAFEDVDRGQGVIRQQVHRVHDLGDGGIESPIEDAGLAQGSGSRVGPDACGGGWLASLSRSLAGPPPSMARPSFAHGRSSVPNERTREAAAPRAGPAAC